MNAESMNISISYIWKQSLAPRIKALLELPDAGRSDCRELEMAPKNRVMLHHYNLLDHLGNTRITFSTLPESYTFKATMESENATDEEAYFTNVPETRVSMAAANNTPDGSKAARVESTDPIGPMAMLRVNRGDTIVLSAYAYYEGDGSTDGLISESALLAALLSSYSGASGISEVSSQTQGALADALDFPQNLVPKTNQTNDDAPKAYINYMQFDEQMNFVTSGFKQISTAAQYSKELVELDPIVFEHGGYLMAYLSNESNELNYVHFDDFKIEHSKTNIIQTDDYTPFGVAINSFSRSHSEPNRFKYNGKEVQEELGTHTLDYGARMYFADIARWGVIDPLANQYLSLSPYQYVENNPVFRIDPDGMENTIYLYATRDENGNQIATNKEMRDMKRGAKNNLKDLGLKTKVRILKGGTPSSNEFDSSDHLVIVGNESSNQSVSGKNGFDAVQTEPLGATAPMRDADNALTNANGNLSTINIESLRNDYENNNISEVKDKVSFGDYSGGVAIHESGHSATMPHSGVSMWYGAFKVDHSVGTYGLGTSEQYTFMGTPDMLDSSKGMTYDVMSRRINPAQRKLWNAKFNGKPKNNAKKRRN